MQGGDGDCSYDRCSEATASAVALCKPFILQAIDCMKLFQGETSLRIADLGCGTGINTLSTVDFVVESLKRRYARECSTSHEIEFEVFFSDLPSNNFNSLFQSLTAQQMEHLFDIKIPTNVDTPLGNSRRTYYAAGVPGSFYDRLFPTGKLHIGISLSALHWMSQIPEAVLDKDSPAWNKGRAWIDGARKEVVEAYAKQAEEDLKAFLHCRAEEMVSGGILFLLMAGRPDSEHPENQLGDPDSREKHPFTSSMDRAWDDLVNEGLIGEETRDAFNIPVYMRSVDEIRREFNQCRAFEIKIIEFQRIPEHSKEKQEEWIRDPLSYAKTRANLAHATLRPIVEAHLMGSSSSQLSEELFERIQRRTAADSDMIRKSCYYGVVVVFAVRK